MTLFSLSGLVAMGIGVAAGAVAFGLLAEGQFGDEADVLSRRFHLQGGDSGAGGKVLGLLEVVDPGATDRLKQAALVTAVGGAAVGILSYALLGEVLS